MDNYRKQPSRSQRDTGSIDRQRYASGICERTRLAGKHQRSLVVQVDADFCLGADGRNVDGPGDRLSVAGRLRAGRTEKRLPVQHHRPERQQLDDRQRSGRGERYRGCDDGERDPACLCQRADLAGKQSGPVVVKGHARRRVERRQRHRHKSDRHQLLCRQQSFRSGDHPCRQDHGRRADNPAERAGGSCHHRIPGQR